MHANGHVHCCAVKSLLLGNCEIYVPDFYFARDETNDLGS